jgi:hypothetical protein
MIDVLARVLILGCSYTRGSYTFHTNGDEELTSSETWLDNLPADITHYCGFGVGYIQWVDILESIELNEFDAVILQESVEPKFQLTKDAQWVTTTQATEFRPPLIRKELQESSIIYSKGIKHRPQLQESLGLEGSDALDYIHDIGKNDSVLNITKACVSHINNKLKAHDIPGYIIQTHEYVDYSNEHTHCEYLDLDPLFTIVGTDPTLVNVLHNGDQGHFTTAGNNLLASKVADAWNRKNLI